MTSTLQDLVDAFRPGLAVAVGPDVKLSAGAVAIDYNVARVRGSLNNRVELREIRSQDARYGGILFEHRPFESRAALHFAIQTLVDFGHAGLRCAVIVREKKQVASIARILGEVFTKVDRRHARNGSLVVAEQPRDANGPPVHPPPVTVVDPALAISYRLAVWPGLFSTDSLDPGTRQLIKALPNEGLGPVLDGGCGYGPLSVVTAGRGGKVTYADVDMRALRLTGDNLEANGLSGTPLPTADLSEISDRSFETIVSNPPTHAGSAVLRKLFENMARGLSPGGSAYLVVRQHLNYEKWLTELGRVGLVRTASGYKVLRLFR